MVSCLIAAGEAFPTIDKKWAKFVQLRFSPSTCPSPEAQGELEALIHSSASRGDPCSDRTSARSKAVDCSDPRHDEAAPPGREYRSSDSRKLMPTVGFAASKIKVERKPIPRNRLEKSQASEWRADACGTTSERPVGSRCGGWRIRSAGRHGQPPQAALREGELTSS